MILTEINQLMKFVKSWMITSLKKNPFDFFLRQKPMQWTKIWDYLRQKVRHKFEQISKTWDWTSQEANQWSLALLSFWPWWQLVVLWIQAFQHWYNHYKWLYLTIFFYSNDLIVSPNCWHLVTVTNFQQKKLTFYILSNWSINVIDNLIE